MYKGIFKVERYGTEYKITMFKTEIDGRRKSTSQVQSTNEERFQSSVSRAKKRIFELASCNSWDFFGTFTLSSEYDREDLSTFKERFTHWIRNQRRKGIDIKYVLVPERHKQGGWHLHGLISGLPVSEVHSFTPTDIGDSNTKAEVKDFKAAEFNRKGYLNWNAFESKFGFCSLSPIKSKKACSRYITKYISKTFDEAGFESGAHLYYASQGLNGAELLDFGVYPEYLPLRDDEHFHLKAFDNEYVKIWWTENPNDIPVLFPVGTASSVIREAVEKMS